jgi:Uma2 family endonuclease
MVTTKLMSVEEFEAMPNDGKRYELVRGELVLMPPPGYEHFRVIGLVSHYLNLFVLPRGLGVVGSDGGFVTARDPDTTREPGVAFIAAERVPTGEDAFRAVRAAPDLAVEVRSPSDSMQDLIDKANEYLAAGARLVWLLDPITRIVIVKTPDGAERTFGVADQLDGGDVLAGFTLRLSEIFQNE